MRILVADDSKSIHTFITLSLKVFNIELVHVYNGQEAVDWIVNNNGDCDLVLMDWEMPVMQGIEALSAIRKVGFDRPIVMVTTKNDPSEIAKAIQEGASEFVMKPFTREIIIEKITMAGYQP